ncbi:DASH complex subunit HSK3 family protein [Aspergillus ruber CBS 135680]|uniref:DASH complex subunit Hsk3 like-domain-containing protein n=1 Tax=Aspergillus ruber (strain CBS 135680) TaxID=1388766 RepID=A0A017SJK8_ASPRC|nr:uncharacterized protein EURHEDRAFT_452436 [Aspergillus ruber CBS 135680]EYE96956.1 hypothetical protein EURHEDRAFT_452436 [Aspergillus ruber CBS 135680]
MPSHYHNPSQSSFRPSILPTPAPASTSASSTSTTKSRQYTHLHSQLAQLNTHLADTENLLRMTAVQAEDMRFLGGYVGGLFMGSAKVLGEEGVVKESQGEAERRIKEELES